MLTNAMELAFARGGLSSAQVIKQITCPLDAIPNSPNKTASPKKETFSKTKSQRKSTVVANPLITKGIFRTLKASEIQPKIGAPNAQLK